MLKGTSGQPLNQNDMKPSGSIAKSHGESEARSYFLIFSEALVALKNLFHYQPAPISSNNSANLTKIYVPKNNQQAEDLENAVQAVENRQFGANLKLVALFSLFATYVSYRIFEAWTAPNSQTETIAVDLDGIIRPHIRRALLSSSSNYSVTCTEENDSTQFFDTWNVFPYTDEGRLIVSTTSPLPNGVSLVQSPMRIITSIPMSQYGRMAASGNALYVTQTGSNTTQVINTEDPTKPYVTKIIKTGAVMVDICVVGSRLYCAGSDKLIKIFDITNPFYPVPLGEVSIPQTNVLDIASMGINNQFGCITQNAFFGIDASDPSNPTITGNVTGLTNTRGIVASPGYYYIGTLTGIVIIDATAGTPSQCAFLPLIGIQDLKYANGFCYVTANFKLYIINVQNPANPLNINNMTYSETIWELLPPLEGLMYYINTVGGMGILDLSNPTYPQIVASGIFSGSGYTAAFQGDYVIFGSSGSSNINIATRRDAFGFSGTPVGGSKGDYNIVLTASALSSGEVINDTETLTLEVQPAVVRLKNISNIIAVVNQLYNAIIINAFIQINGKSLSYSLDCQNKSSLSLNPFSAELSGTPTEIDVGSTTCTITAIDGASASETSFPFNISVFYGPSVTFIENQIAVVGQAIIPINLSASSKDPASRSNITVSNLPPSFNFTNDTITGIATTQNLGTYTIYVTATDQNGISNTKSFILTVALPGVPVFLTSFSSLIATIGNDFSFTIPQNAAVSPSNPNTPIIYSAKLLDGSELPSWLNFDGKRFYGTPPSTAILFNPVTFNIALTATQKLSDGTKTSANTVFGITVSGTSAANNAARWGAPLLGIAGTILGLRICLFNRLVSKPNFIRCVNLVSCIFCACLDKKTVYFSSEKDILERQSVEHTFSTPRTQIASFQTFYSTSQELSPTWHQHPNGELFDWLHLSYDEDVFGKKNCKIFADYVPELKGIEAIKIYALDEKGYQLEKITFTKQTSDDNNFSRECNTDRDMIGNIKFMFGNDPTPVARPQWLEYNRRSNKINFNNCPSLKEMEPLTIFIFGQKMTIGKKEVDLTNKILETIYINHAPNNRKIISAAEGSLLNEFVSKSSKAKSSTESKAQSSIEMAELDGSTKKDSEEYQNLE